MFPFVPQWVPAVTDETPMAVAERLARELVRALAELPDPPALEVTASDGRVACRVRVWDAAQPVPAAGRRGRPPARRDECQADILAVVAAARRALTRKEVVRELKLVGKSHGPSTVAKALADLTRAGRLVNPKDKKGYRLPAWRRDKTPSLFD